MSGNGVVSEWYHEQIPADAMPRAALLLATVLLGFVSSVAAQPDRYRGLEGTWTFAGRFTTIETVGYPSSSLRWNYEPETAERAYYEIAIRWDDKENRFEGILSHVAPYQEEAGLRVGDPVLYMELVRKEYPERIDEEVTYCSALRAFESPGRGVQPASNDCSDMDRWSGHAMIHKERLKIWELDNNISRTIECVEGLSYRLHGEACSAADYPTFTLGYHGAGHGSLVKISSTVPAIEKNTGGFPWAGFAVGVAALAALALAVKLYGAAAVAAGLYALLALAREAIRRGSVYAATKLWPKVLKALRGGTIRTIDNTDSLTGLTPRQIEKLIPKHWVKKPSKTGGGVKYYDPNKTSHQVRVMPPDKYSGLAVKRGWYAVVSGGKIHKVRIPLKGNPVLKH